MGAGPPGRESADSVELGGGPEPTLSFRVSWGLLSSPSSEAVRTALPFPAPTCTSVLCFCGSTTNPGSAQTCPPLSAPLQSWEPSSLTRTVVWPASWVHLSLCSQSDLLGTQDHAPEGSLSLPTPPWPSGSGEVHPGAVLWWSAVLPLAHQHGEHAWLSLPSSLAPSLWGAPALPSLPLLFPPSRLPDVDLCFQNTSQLFTVGLSVLLCLPPPPFRTSEVPHSCLLACIASGEKSAVILCSFWNGSFFPLLVAFEMSSLSLVFSAWI